MSCNTVRRVVWYLALDCHLARDTLTGAGLTFNDAVRN
jgi:hypothetical protein